MSDIPESVEMDENTEDEQEYSGKSYK